MTAAASVGFYLFQYVLDNSQAGVYALFGAIALGVLSQVSGPPAQRTRTLLAALVVGIGLVALGTALAVNVWAASAGMLVIGFTVSFAGVAGPRFAGMANGLQLLYILPSFPPYAPELLGDRVLGLVVGVGLLAVADRWLWPIPTPRSYRDRLAVAVEQVAAHLSAVREQLADPTATAQLAARSSEASRAAAGLRLGKLPLTDRPAAPSARDRGLRHAGQAVRLVDERVAALSALLRIAPPGVILIACGPMLAAINQTLRAVAAYLADPSPDGGAGRSDTDGSAPNVAEVDAAVERFGADREQHLRHYADQDALRWRLRVATAVTEAAGSTRALVLAARAAGGAPPLDDPLEGADSFFYTRLSTRQLWWIRLRGHLTPRSVYFQNAVRLAVGLAVARFLAEVLDLSHGFWVLLATLSLMRTSAVATRTALVPAFLGTMAGALLSAALLTAVGEHTGVYEILMPAVVGLGLLAGPVFGVAAGQIGFTLAVTVIFAQLAPADWQLAEARLLDVVIGGLIGALIGAAVWPRGGTGELRRAVTAALLGAAGPLAGTARLLATGADDEPAPRHPVQHWLLLADATHAQYRSEPASDEIDWSRVLGLAHRIVGSTSSLRRRYPDPSPTPWPQFAAEVGHAGEAVAGSVGELAGWLAEADPAAPQPTRDDHLGLLRRWLLDADPPAAERPDPALRLLDTWAWLAGLDDDVARLRSSLLPQPNAAMVEPGSVTSPRG